MQREGDELDGQISGVAALAEPVRRDLYRYVVSQDHDVSRDEAADACKIGRPLAAFHLDKLVEQGLLEATYRRLTGRSGPGAGRPSKLYHRSARQLIVTLPPRSYELAARLFAEALDGPQTEAARVRLDRVARSFGESLGSDAAANAPETTEPDSLLIAAESVLTAYGYEPYRDAAGDIRLRNCPFHDLAQLHRQLVCGMNLQLMDGLVEALKLTGVTPVLDPRPGECCVAFRKSLVKGGNGSR